MDNFWIAKLIIIETYIGCQSLGPGVQWPEVPSLSSYVTKGKSVNLEFLSFLWYKMGIINTLLGIWGSEWVLPSVWHLAVNKC